MREKLTKTGNELANRVTPGGGCMRFAEVETNRKQNQYTKDSDRREWGSPIPLRNEQCADARGDYRRGREYHHH